MPFFLDGNPSQGEISEAVNYLLGNFGQSSTADPSTGQIVGPSGVVTGYLYKYLSVKYADSFDGTVNFSNVPTGRLYYGVRNSDSSVESTNPADYIWYLVAGGFGSTKFLWYITTGGRQIQFSISTTLPNSGWVQDDGTAIDLDIISGSGGVANFVVIRITNDSSAPTDAECIGAIGRTPIDGDLCTINYNSGISSIVYKYTTGWAIFQKYITGDLIVANSIVGNNIAANTITAANLNVTQLSAISANMGTITAGDISVGSSPAISGTSMSGSGTHLYSNGRFVLGDSTKNFVYNGSVLTINGELVGTNNVLANAITVSGGATSGGNGATVTVSLQVGDRVFINGYSGPSAYNTLISRTLSLRANSSAIVTTTEKPGFDGLANFFPSAPISSVYTAPSTGSFTFDIVYSASNGVTSIQVIGLKK
jgi:hypothetical protein